MNITAKYYPLKNGPKALKEGSTNSQIGMATLVLDDCFVVESIRVCQGEDGSLFILNQQYKRGTGENAKWVDIAHPITAECREQVMKAVADAVENYTPAPADA